MRNWSGHRMARSADEERTLMLGRCAGILFLAGALASAPATALLTNPEPGWYMHLVNLLAALSGGVCLLLPWRRINAIWLHLLPVVAVAEIVLSVSVLGVHGEVNLWFFLLVAVFVGYAFRPRLQIAAHMTFMGVGFLVSSMARTPVDPDADATVAALVAIPTLFVAAGVVAWLREGLEAREAQMSALVIERELEARTDSLTGLLNRRALMDALERAMAPGAKPQTFALFDLDGFKAFNDRYGHPAGDALLVRLGQSLLDEVRGRGHAFRLGGDEFCVLFDLVGPAADALVDRCADALADSDPDVGVSASYGMASLPGEATDASDALSVVDTRMYEAKGRRSAALERAADVLRHERRRGSRLAATLPWLLETPPMASASPLAEVAPAPRLPTH